MDWIQGNLQNSLNSWNTKMQEIWTLISQSPEEFKGGGIWNAIVTINGAVQAIGLALLVLFFVVGIMRTFGNFAEVKRPEQAFKLFIRFVIAKGVVTYGMNIMMSIFKIGQGIVSTIIDSAGVSGVSNMKLPQEIITAIGDVGFFDKIPLGAVTIIGSLFITVLAFVMILTVYGRFFKLYLYTAIAPIPLSSLAGQQTEQIGRSFIKSYIGVCLEGAIIVLSCIIFSLFATTQPSVNAGDPATTMVWKYIEEIIFNLLILVGTIRMSDRVVKEMMGL